MTDHSIKAIRERAAKRDAIPVPPWTGEHHPLVAYAKQVEADRDALLRFIDDSSAANGKAQDGMIRALAPLSNIWTAWLAGALDEDRPDRRKRGVDGDPLPFGQVELFSGRGGRRLLTLQDAKFAVDVLAGAKIVEAVPLPPASCAADPDGPCSSYHSRAVGVACSNCGHAKEDHARDQGIDPSTTAKKLYDRRNSHVDSRLGYLYSNDDAELDVAAADLIEALTRTIAKLEAKTSETVSCWPFRESPGEFANRLGNALRNIGASSPGETHLFSAVRSVLIEKPPALAAWLDPGAAAKDSQKLSLIETALRHAFPLVFETAEDVTTENVLGLGKKVEEAILGRASADDFRDRPVTVGDLLGLARRLGGVSEYSRLARMISEEFGDGS